MSDQTPRELLSKFYSENHLDADGGQSSSSVKIELGKKFHFYFPNFDQRRKAVIKHDIHHLVTGYSTNINGESEISAWELASGCKKYLAAFFIDLSGMMIGVPFNFVGVLKAFTRGRRTKNLYHDQFSTEEALDKKISDLKIILFLDKFGMDQKPGLVDFFIFSFFLLMGSFFSIISLLFLPFIIFYSIFIIMKNKMKSNG